MLKDLLTLLKKTCNFFELMSLPQQGWSVLRSIEADTPRLDDLLCDILPRLESLKVYCLFSDNLSIACEVVCRHFVLKYLFIFKLLLSNSISIG